MKKSIILMSVLVLIFVGKTTFGQEDIGKRGMGRRSRMGLFDENHERRMDQPNRPSFKEKMIRREPGPKVMHPQPEQGCRSCQDCPMMGSGRYGKMNRKKAAGFCALMFGIMLIVHILVSIWVYSDIRKRNSGSGIWVVIALLTGLFGTAVYALVRIGDNKK